MLSDISIIMRFGGVAQSGCCLRQAGVKSRGKKKRKRREKIATRGGEDVRRQSETSMRDIGMQIGDTGRAW